MKLVLVLVALYRSFHFTAEFYRSLANYSHIHSVWFVISNIKNSSSNQRLLLLLFFVCVHVHCVCAYECEAKKKQKHIEMWCAP